MVVAIIAEGGEQIAIKPAQERSDRKEVEIVGRPLFYQWLQLSICASGPWLNRQVMFIVPMFLALLDRRR